METKFQTSFIPKKPLISEQKIRISHGHTSILMIIASIIFIISLGGAIFTFFWKDVLVNKQEDYKLQLAASEKAFDTTLIETLKRVNTKIDLSSKLLANHLAVSDIFPMIGLVTIEGVRFNSFDFSSPNKDSNDVKVSMSGVGNSFKAIAFQSKVFGESNILKNPVLSNLSVDQNGSVKFNFSATVDAKNILYAKKMENNTQSEISNTSSDSTNTTNP